MLGKQLLKLSNSNGMILSFWTTAPSYYHFINHPEDWQGGIIKDSAVELRGVLNKKVTVFMFRLFQKWKEHHNNPSGDPSIGWTNANAMAANAAEAKKELTNYFSV